MDYNGNSFEKPTKPDKDKRIILIVLSLILISVIASHHISFSLPFDLHYNFEDHELSVEAWQEYKPYRLSSMTQDQKEQYAYDYMLDKYGVEVDVKYFGIPGGTTDFDRFYTMAVVSPKTSDDPFEYYHIYFKGNGKLCDDYYLHEIKDFVTDEVRRYTEDLPYDCVVNVNTYTLSPYFPTYKMKRLAKKDPMEFLKLKRTSTRIHYVFSKDCVEHKDELCDALKSKTSYMYVHGNLYFIDGDINQIDFSQLDPSTLLAFY